MTHIYIEAESNKTPEYNFLKAIIAKFFPDKKEEVDFEFKFLDGVDKLFSKKTSNIQTIQKAQAEGTKVIVIADADTIEKGWGYEERKKQIEEGMQQNSVSFDYFIYPNNRDEGDVETLMEEIARKDLHKTFFDCFEKYEMCISGENDENGKQKYNTPNLKGKLHTYITAQKLSNKKKSKLGKGNWLFDDKEFWDLDSEVLNPLKEFLKKYL